MQQVQDAVGGFPTGVVPDEVQARVAVTQESVLLLGGAGTGKTTCLVGAMGSQALRWGPQRVIGITHDRSAARSWQGRVARTTGGLSPRVTTVTALAGEILADTGDSDLRLLTAPEQESRIRDLLTGSVSSGSVEWPAEWKQAVGTRSFARQLRRAVSHVRRLGWEPDALARAAADQADQAWRAVAQFTSEYLEVLDWEGSLDYVEAVLRALRRIESGAWTGGRPAALLVDDAQDLAGLESALLRAILAPGGILIAAADPDQSVWSFRGADPAVVSGMASDARCLVLPRCYRGSAALRDARQALLGGRWYAGLPARAAQGHRSAAVAGPASGGLRLLHFDDRSAQSAHLAAILRRARAAGIAWRDMAVLAASTADIPELGRGLGRARIPVAVPADDLPLAAQPAVATLLAAARLSLDWGRRPPDPQTLEQVLASELGGLAARDLRAMRRWLRGVSAGDRPLDVGDLITDAGLRESVPGWLSRTAVRLDALAGRIAAAAHAQRSGAPPAEVLWHLWDGPWPRRLRDRALAAGAGGIAADRDLDAVMRLFRSAERAPQRWGGTRGMAAFLAEVAAQEIAAEPDLQQQSFRDRVAVMSLLRAKGRQWRLVVVTGVQESAFGRPRPATGLFEVDRLTQSELLATPAAAPAGEQRRMLAMALGRSSGDVVLCAAGGSDDPPAAMAADLPAKWERIHGLPESPQTAVELIARLRSTAAQPGSRGGAARSVARMRSARAGELPLIPAADARRWPGAADWTRAPAPIRSTEQPLLLSASAVAAISECPLRWFLAREAHASRPSGSATRFGLIVHDAVAAMIEALNRGEHVDPEVLLGERWNAAGYDAAWHAQAERDLALAALRRALVWWRSRSGAVAPEVGIDVVIPIADPGSGDSVRVTGSIDALETTADGASVVWDFKTRRTRFTRQQVAQSIQLATYQLAVLGGGGTTGGAGYVQLCLPAAAGDPGPLVLGQPQFDAEEQLQRMSTALGVVRSELFPAQPGPGCRTCEFRTACPAQGRRP